MVLVTVASQCSLLSLHNHITLLFTHVIHIAIFGGAVTGPQMPYKTGVEILKALTHRKLLNVVIFNVTPPKIFFIIFLFILVDLVQTYKIVEVCVLDPGQSWQVLFIVF